MKRFVLIGLLLGSCASDTDTVRRTLEDDGFYDVQDLGFTLFGCGKDDDFHNAFRAKRRMPDGSERTIDGVVCCGLLKNCTVRH